MNEAANLPALKRWVAANNIIAMILFLPAFRFPWVAGWADMYGYIYAIAVFLEIILGGLVPLCIFIQYKQAKYIVLSALNILLPLGAGLYLHIQMIRAFSFIGDLKNIGYKRI